MAKSNSTPTSGASQSQSPPVNPLNSLVNQISSTPYKGNSLEELAFYEKHQNEIANSNQNMSERKKYAECIYGFTCVWCIFIGIVIIGKGKDELNLSDNLILALIGSTTVNVLVFFRLVTKYLFNSEKST